MSERLTAANPINPTASGQGYMVHGRATRPEMLKLFREHYQRQLDEATEMLALTDEQLIVTTYRGVWAQDGKREVTE